MWHRGLLLRTVDDFCSKLTTLRKKLLYQAQVYIDQRHFFKAFIIHAHMDEPTATP